MAEESSIKFQFIITLGKCSTPSFIKILSSTKLGDTDFPIIMEILAINAIQEGLL